MRVGEIYYFTSGRVRGRDERPKYHLYVCEGDWRDDGDRVFLFITKSNSFADGFEIRKADGYDCLKLDVSYIGCASTVAYDTAYLRMHAGKPLWRLRKDDVDPLLLTSRRAPPWKATTSPGLRRATYVERMTPLRAERPHGSLRRWPRAYVAGSCSFSPVGTSASMVLVAKRLASLRMFAACTRLAASASFSESMSWVATRSFSSRGSIKR
jgi:hypothetical protein